MIKKIISGGQTGADLGGLIAAKEIGIETGGWIPKGFLTEEGNKPELGEIYDLQETETDIYGPRTYANARDSEGTLIFASNFKSPGTKMTIKAAQRHNKPCYCVDIADQPEVQLVEGWIKENEITILNIAGNRESKSPAIEIFVQEFVKELLENLSQLENQDEIK